MVKKVARTRNQDYPEVMFFIADGRRRHHIDEAVRVDITEKMKKRPSDELIDVTPYSRSSEN